MKTVIADYQYKVYCLRIVPLWGDPVYLTGHVKDLNIDGTVYHTDSGYSFSGLASEANMAPGMLDLSGISEIAGIPEDKIRAGVFDNARVYLFATTWNNPIPDEEELGVAFAGKTEMKDGRYSIQLMLMGDVLGQSVGQTYTPSCPKTFGSQDYADCKFVITPESGTLTSVVSNSSFIDNTRTEAADYFGLGTIEFTTGANANLKPLEIKSYTLAGEIVTYEPFYYPVLAGDAYILKQGCRKRLVDCQERSNIDNFGGFSFVPTSSTYGQMGTR